MSKPVEPFTPAQRRAVRAALKEAWDSRLDEELGTKGDSERDLFFDGWHEGFVEAKRAIDAVLKSRRS